MAQGSNKIIWNKKQLVFLKDNWQTMTAKQLSDSLGITRTIVRMKKYELGLYKMKLQYWTKEQVEFLKQNYDKIGDVELASIFQTKWKKNKNWTKSQIAKKRIQLGLHRTIEDYQKIITKNCSPGGNAFTILKNSSSINMHPSWVAQRMAWRNKPMQEEIKKYPDLINMGKNIIQLKRKIKNNEK